MFYRKLPDIEVILSLLEYNPETGDFIRKTTTSPKAQIGSKANKETRDGYHSVMIMSKKYQAHRLAWFIMNGDIGDHDIDHINGNRADNRIFNLRIANRSENMQNLKGCHKDSKTGCIGVYKHKAGGYFSEIMVSGKKIYLGYFKFKYDAEIAYNAAKRIHHPFCTI